MSATASGLARVSRFYEAPIGKKVVMAVTGLILVGFVLGHMTGNLQIYLPVGEDGVHPIDKYGALLHASEELLWGARLFLLGSVVLHIWSAIQLASAANAARPVRYVKQNNLNSSYASRTMYWSGPIVGLFIVYHLLHFTTGTLHFSGFVHGQVYANVFAAFQNFVTAGFYVVAMALLGLHLYHGTWSMFQTLGVDAPRWNNGIRAAAKVVAVAMFVGFSAVPVSIAVGVLPAPVETRAPATH